MNFVYTMIIVNGLIWIPWLWRYKFIPYQARKELRIILQAHPRWNEIQKIEGALTDCYKKIKSRRIAEKACKELGLRGREYLYGEIDLLHFFTILERIAPKPQHIFYDLGAGTGKAVFCAGLFFPIKKACGIEFIQPLANLSRKLKQQLALETKHLEFIQHNFLEYDFSDGDIIFVNATALKDKTWELLTEKFLRLKAGSYIITTTKQINHPQFQPRYEGHTLMSWGMNSIYIYEKR